MRAVFAHGDSMKTTFWHICIPTLLLFFLFSGSAWGAPLEQHVLGGPLRHAAMDKHKGTLALAAGPSVFIITPDSAVPKKLALPLLPADVRLYWLRWRENTHLAIHTENRLAIYAMPTAALVQTIILPFTPSDGALCITDFDSDGTDDIFYFQQGALLQVTFSKEAWGHHTVLEGELPLPSSRGVIGSDWAGVDAPVRFTSPPPKRLTRSVSTRASLWASQARGGTLLGLERRDVNGKRSLTIFEPKTEGKAQVFKKIPIDDKLDIVRVFSLSDKNAPVHYSMRFFPPLRGKGGILPVVENRLHPLAGNGPERSWQGVYAPFLPAVRPELPPPLRFPVLHSTLAMAAKEAFLNLASREEVELRLLFFNPDTDSYAAVEYPILISGDKENVASFLDLRIEQPGTSPYLLYRANSSTVVLAPLLVENGVIKIGKTLNLSLPMDAIFLGAGGGRIYWLSGGKTLLSVGDL